MLARHRAPKRLQAGLQRSGRHRPLIVHPLRDAAVAKPPLSARILHD
jgi:hypothetical protein